MQRATPMLGEQRMRALELANRVRRTRAGLKARIADGQLTAGEIILASPPEAMGMSILQVLASQRNWGEKRSRAVLRQLGVREDKPIGSLTDRQRLAVVARLGQARAGGAV